jgi:16S rRNA (guanine527-N7)-methyltransferase
MDVVQSRFAEWTAAEGISLSDRQLAQFENYFGLLVEWNEKMNLTGITEREAVYEKHFFDSVTVARAADMKLIGSAADIGSGAGFPSLPLKIAFPHLQVTIVDSLGKRIRFLEQVVSDLALEGVACIHGRAEDVARLPEHRDRYDLVTARAVARMAVLNELCLPFARVGGLFVAMKGTDIDGELEESRYAAGLLGGDIRGVQRLRLPMEQSERHLVTIAKKIPTPKAYPRKAGIPLKMPLIKG